ncbi:EF-hand calcium-binding domain-containing protein 6 [Centropristis striata]|uniref:EF-hand calcium-binding domain-containing protein 6 n=1 Tax=Centropristis striata TaxID=184440 RepID=UPI0027E0813E|nr:EF-hand calcium-binding domain-containing protein 6 [Centropristis striata]
MSKLLPLHSGLGQLVMDPRPHTALGSTTHLSTKRQTSEGSRKTWIHSDQVNPGRRLTLEQVEPLIQGRLASIKSACMTVDPDGRGLVSREEFRRVLMSLLSVSHNQLDTVLNEVCERSGEDVDYVQFLRRFSRAPAAHRASSSCSSVRRGSRSTSMSLAEIQKHLKDKIGGNLRTVIRVFSLFDCNREGHIQQREFRRILDNYCIHLTDKEFQRLWKHYSPNNTSTISYELFLDKLGFGDSHNFKIAPVCTKLEVSSRGTTPPEKVKQWKQSPQCRSSPCDAPSILQHRKLQTLFYDKMCMNSTPVWQALQAFDTTHSGLVKQEVLRAILSSFIFPMNPHSFQKLTSRYGVRATGPVRWKHFLGHFMSPVKAEGDTSIHSNRALEQPAHEKDTLDLQDIYPRLKEIFSMLDTKEAGSITRADLRHLLKGPDGTQTQTGRSQITELLNTLDPQHTGVIQLTSLERLNPSITCAPSPANTAEPRDVPEDTEDTAISSVLAAIKLCDPQHTGYITREDMKNVLCCYGMPISDTHFNKLCETSCSGPDSYSELVHYTGFLRNLGVPLTDGTSPSPSHGTTDHTERLQPSPEWTQQSVRGQRPPSSLQLSSDTYNILDIIFQRMRSTLEHRHCSLTDRIQAMGHSSDGTLSETDVQKILEDSWVMLDDKNLHKFTEALGFRDGRIESSVFLLKYEEATAREGQQRSEGLGEKDEVDSLLTSADQCLASMKTRIKIIHGDNLTAFRLMDRKHKGVVDCHDFKELYSSLGFFCREAEYQRLLDLIGLHPGGNLNYAEFVNVVENNGKQGTQRVSVQQQLHELLACEAQYKWADMSKVLCQFDTEGQGWIQKESLRGLLFTYALPLRPDEFDQLWSRYDPDGRGCVAVCDFLEKLGFQHEGELRAGRQKLNPAVGQQNADRPLSSDAASLECIGRILQKNYKGLSKSLTHLETNRDGTVTVEELLSLLQTYSCSVQREQLVNHLHRLEVSMDDNCRRLAYMDFLSAFDHKAEKTGERPPASPDAVHHIESLDSLSPDLALSRMKELVSGSTTQLYKAFLAFDQGNTGTVKALKFRQVLEIFCARLSDKQYRYMLTKLQLDRENCTVNWRDFLNKFQSKSPRMSESCLSKTRSPIKTQGPEITEHLQQIQEVVSGHFYEITKELLDLDPSNSTTISKEQFRRLCDHHCLRLTNDQFECVWSQMPVNEKKKLQYRAFLKRFGALSSSPYTKTGDPNNNVPSASCEPRETASAPICCSPQTAGTILQRTKSAPQCTSKRSTSVGRPGTGSLLGSMERRLHGVVQRWWKEILRSCTQEDPQQEGHISTSSFLEILQALSISMSREQFDYLAAKYDIVNNDCVSYHNFLRHFLLNLKPAETKTSYERRKLPLPATPTSQATPSKECVQAMLRMHDAVHSSWTSIRRCFLTCDHSRTGSVSVQDFRKVLRNFSVKLSEEDFFHLSSYFDANTTGRICYNNFLWAFLH